MQRYRLLTADYDAIDRELVGPAAMSNGRVAPSNEPIAPPQGNPFLGRVKSIKDLMRGYSSKFQ